MNNTTGADSASARPRFQAVLLRRDAIVLVLTWAASGVDAISYLGLGHVFTANMTGNAALRCSAGSGTFFTGRVGA